MIAQVPITLSLPTSTVVVPQDGMQVIVPIDITSTSETALVAVSCLLSGVQAKYAASDTNPSGSRQYCDPGRHLYAGRDGELGRVNRIDELHLVVTERRRRERRTDSTLDVKGML